MISHPNVGEFKTWFEQHVALGGKPYTLDLDQARAVYDNHKNTLVTARAGSGKTRVIVAKVAYLVASKQAKLSEIAVFMFNRTAAAEVNERIGAVEVDGKSLSELNFGKEIKVAATFHKFALDIVKRTGERPQLISETEHEVLVKTCVRKVLQEEQRKISVQEYTEILRLANSFIARAGQQYVGESGLAELCTDVQDYIAKHQDDENFSARIYLHKTCLAVYQEYLLALNFPKIDFNILMARATRILQENAENLPAGSQRFPIQNQNHRPNPLDAPVQNFPAQPNNSKFWQIRHYKYIMVDEYQDFSYLFFGIIQAIRRNCPGAHLFAVGDDWQAINRFAGSDVKYFIDFAQYFPEDVVNIPLSTNYRSDRKIVEQANQYMLTHYNPEANKAIPFSRKPGKIKTLNPQKTKFRTDDLKEDALGDARYQLALAEVCGGAPEQYLEVAQLLKTLVKIIKHHRKAQILLLHRHNFTSFAGVSLENLLTSLQNILTQEKILLPSVANMQIRGMTMHKSKGLESDVVILLEFNRDQILSSHPHATIFEIFGDTLAAEKADQQRLLYVALTRAKHKLYLLSTDKKSPLI